MGHHDLFEVDGVRVSRFEDLRLITGAGTYASDWNLPGQLHAFFLRSDRAHAKIVSIDTAGARKHPGVAGIYTGEDAVRTLRLARDISEQEYTVSGGETRVRPDRARAWSPRTESRVTGYGGTS